MRPVKRIDQTINLAKLISSILDRDIKLLLIGPTQPKEVQLDRVSVVYTGLLDNPISLIKTSDFNLNTSIHDSFNYALLEAMANGVPQITTNVAGISDYIARNKTGLVLPVKLSANTPIFEQYKIEIFDENEIAMMLVEYFSNLDYSGVEENCYKCSELFSSNFFVKRFTSLITQSTSNIWNV